MALFHQIKYAYTLPQWFSSFFANRTLACFLNVMLAAGDVGEVLGTNSDWSGLDSPTLCSFVKSGNGHVNKPWTIIHKGTFVRSLLRLSSLIHNNMIFGASAAILLPWETNQSLKANMLKQWSRRTLGLWRHQWICKPTLKPSFSGLLILPDN